MSTNEQPAHFQVFETYFNHNESASLSDFVGKNSKYIVNNSDVGEDVVAVWIKRFRQAYKFKYGVDPNPLITQRNPDWGLIALKILKSNIRSPTTIPVSRSPDSTPNTSSSGSTTTAAPVTAAFLEEFKNRHKQMKNASKWELPSGQYVEDVMFNFGKTYPYEHAAHSFILDTNDPVWLELLPDERDRNVIVNHKKKELPASSARLDEYLNSYIGKTTFNDLMDHARSQVFSFEKEFEMDWAQSTMETALRLYPAKFIPLTNQTESDILKRIWVFIDKAFDDVPVDVRSGEMECASSSLRRNSGPDVTKRKLHGHKADLLMKTALGEYGCCEAGKADKGAKGTKEKYEAGLKGPKMLKDMTWALSATCTQTDDLMVVGLIISGLKIFALLMDRPSTYICRVTRTEPLYFPETIDDFTVGLGMLIKFIYQVKQVIMTTYNASKRKTIQPVTMKNCLIKPEQLQPCVTSPKLRPAKRQRTDSSSTSSITS